MIIKDKDIITLDDNKKYIVISSANYKNINYYYLLDINDCKNAMICYEENDELIKTEMKKIDEKIVILLLEKINSITNQLL